MTLFLLTAGLLFGCSDAQLTAPTLASVAVKVTPTLTVGQTTQATATLTSTDGQSIDVQGDTVAWSSSNNQVASVSTKGMVTALKVGTTQIRASLLGKSDSATVIVADLPTSPDGEPAYIGSPQVLILRDEFDYATFADANANGWRGTDGSNTSDTRFTTDPLGANQIIAPGFDGTGHAMRLVYNGVETNAGSNQEARAWSRLQTDAVAAKPGHAFYITYYFRMTPGGGFKLDQDPTHLIKVKWLELWNTPGSDRAQFNTSYSTCINDVPFVGAGGSGTMFEFYGSGSSTSKCLAGQVRGPFAFAGAGQWHRATHKYMTKSAPGAHDGVAQMWVDGVLIVNVNQADCGVAVPGGVGGQAWCVAADLDAIFSQETVTKISLGSVQTAALWPFTIDYDRMKIWRD